MSVRYSPGEIPVVVTPLGFVVLAAGTPAALAARIRTLVAAGRGLGGVIEALTEAYGASLAAIPPFAVALVEGESVRFAVRGDLTLVVEARGAVDEISGSGVTTWSERVTAEVSMITLTAAAAPPAELPVRDGVVLASGLEWDAAAPPARDSEPVIDRAALVVAVPAGAAEPVIDEAEPVVAAEPAVPEPVAEPAHQAPSSPTAGFEELWGETIVRGVDDPLVHPSADAPEGADEVVVIEGDHDGETISIAQARALRAGHDSVPAPLAIPRPPAPGRIRVSTGQVVTLDRTVVIGRRPRSTRVTGTDLPHLVAVDSPQQDISRSHVELRVEGDSILATDLRTTNGTTLLRQGADPMRLHPGEGTVVIPGDVLDLGDGITVTVEELR